MANTGIYNNFKSGLMKGTFNLNSGGDAIKVALMGNFFVFNASHLWWTDISSNEVTGINYTTGGITLAGQTVTIPNQTAIFKASNVTWPSSTLTAYAAVLFDLTATHHPLICSFDFGSAQVSSNGNFTITWSSNGIITLS